MSVISELGKQRMMDLNYKDWIEEFQAAETPHIMTQGRENLRTNTS